MEDDSPVDEFPTKISFLTFIFVTGLFSFILSPAIVYYSVLAYGLPAAIFLTLGYIVWLVLIRTNRRKAIGFSIGFFPPVLLVLIFYLFLSPLLVALILTEFGCFWVVLTPLRRQLKSRAEN
jgi:hypothetical protein